MRYAAHLLFQYRVVPDSRKRRTCESRVLVFEASDPRSALKEAQRLGRGRAFRYCNVQGGTVHVEFLGLIDLIGLEPECETDEVWYRMFTTSHPERLLTPVEHLSALRDLRNHVIGSAMWAAPAQPRTRGTRSRTAKRSRLTNGIAQPRTRRR